MSRPHIQRQRKLIQAGMQLRLTAVFFAVTVVGILFQVFLFNRAVVHLDSAYAAGIADPSLVRSMLIRNALLTFGVVAPLTALIGILYSHRVAGPAFAMERHLRVAAAERQVYQPLQIRRTDELQGLCDAMNLALERVAEGPQHSAYEDGSAEDEQDRGAAYPLRRVA